MSAEEALFTGTIEIQGKRTQVRLDRWHWEMLAYLTKDCGLDVAGDIAQRTINDRGASLETIIKNYVRENYDRYNT